MDRATARTNLKDTWLGERGSFWSTAELNMLLDEANRETYNLVCGLDPSYFLSVTSVFTYASTTERLDITGASYLNAKYLKILTVERVTTNAAISNTNLPQVLTPVDFRQLVDHYDSGFSGLSETYGWHYALQGDYMYIGPIPAQDLYLRIKWIPVLVDMADATVLLNGQLAEHHNLVVVTAAVMALGKSREKNDRIDALYQMLRTNLERTIEGRQVQEPQFIRYTGW